MSGSSLSETEVDSQTRKKRHRSRAKRSQSVRDETDEPPIHVNIPGLQERLRRPWPSTAPQMRSAPSSTNQTNFDSGNAGNRHHAQNAGLGTAASWATASPPGHNVSSPPTLRADTPPPPTGANHDFCTNCAKNLGDLGAIIDCDAQFHVHEAAIPRPFRQSVRQAIAFRGRIDEQQKIMNAAIATRNQAKRELRLLEITLINIPAVQTEGE
ncbi:MAG: hypothetical protein Q9168_004707 [Polycauliona sp. 1 TL-2023]